MTSKLRRTIVGVGIAFGGAAPGCFGRTDVRGDFATPSESDDGNQLADARAPEAGPTDGAPPDRADPSPVPDAMSPGDADVADANDAAVIDAASDAASDADVTDADVVDAGNDAAVSDAGVTDADVADAATDAPIDPFCDVSWPPTKGGPGGRVACVDPLGECKNVEPPWRCIRLLAPYHCDTTADRVGPLYCISGEWHCPPGTDDGSRCRCWGPLPAGQTCTDAGPL